MKMGKLTTYLLMFSGLTLIFWFFGLLGTDSSTNALLTLLLDPSNLNNAQIWKIVILGSISAIGGIFVGVFYKNVELTSASIVVPFLFNIMWDFTKVFNVIKAESSFLAIILFAPLLFVFLMTMYEYWRGMTT